MGNTVRLNGEKENKCLLRQAVQHRGISFSVRLKTMDVTSWLFDAVGELWLHVPLLCAAVALRGMECGSKVTLAKIVP